MKTQTQKLFLALLLLSAALAANAQGTAFTYQGRFTDNGAPYTGNLEIQATLWDAVSGGSQIAANIPAQVVVGVTNGLFVAPLNFGANFPGANRWLKLEVRTNVGAFIPLSPRQPLTPTPYAITAGNLTGPVASASLAGTYSSALALNNAANSFSGNGAGLTALDAGQLTSGTVPDSRLGANVARTDQVWLLGGNAGTTPGTHFVGTTGNQPLDLRVNGARAFRLEPNATSPNVIGGYVGNSVSPGVFGATIAGGGRDGFVHTIYAPHGTIGGGDRNTVSGEDGTIAGGGGNFLTGNYASIGGGLFNNNFAYVATIAGGRSNTIQSYSDAATIGGGYLNTIQPNTVYATIGGGVQNTIQPYANKATIAGGYFNTIETYGDVATIGGGYANTILFDAQRATISGGDFNTIQPSAYSATIGGGTLNTIQMNSRWAIIGGGYQNAIGIDSVSATIGGGIFNTIQTNASYATIGGGYANTIQHIAGDNDSYNTIAGGGINIIEPNAVYATIGGGSQNTIQSNATYATVPGGFQNSAASDAFAAGHRAKANHQGSFVWADSQGADFASTTVNQFCIRANGGVQLNGDTPVFFGSTLGQKLNLYGTHFAIGIQNSVQYSRVGVGCGFGWYAGGVHNDNTFHPGGGTALMTLTSGGLAVNGLFVHASDRNLKENFATVQPREMLEKVLALPLSSWNLKADPATRHVGPMAQDFYAAFNLGADDKHIATVDADGVALAAIQGLNQKLEEKNSEIQSLRVRLEKVEQLLARSPDASTRKSP